MNQEIEQLTLEEEKLDEWIKYLHNTLNDKFLDN
jgi:hypothetical protein